MKAVIQHPKRLLLALLLSGGALSLPAATLKLNLEIQKQSASDLCVAGTNHDVNFRITNNDSVSVDLSNLTVVMYFDSDITISVASCGAWATNTSTALYSAVGCAVTSGPTCTLAGKKANQSVTLSFGSLAIGAGQAATFQAQVWRGGWAPFDVGCDNYSQPGTSTSWNNNSGYLLYQSGSLVCEYTNSSTQDAASGVAPCSGASGCGAAGSPTFTPTVTPTATPVPPTPTRSITVTFSASPSPAGTVTYTPTISPSPTRSPTRSASPSPTRTPSPSPSPVPATPTITPTPLMALVKSSNVSTAVLGSTLTYSLWWQNDSASTVTYPITDVLSSSLTFVGCDNSCGQSGQTITWSFSAAAGTSGTVKVWARVSSLP